MNLTAILIRNRLRKEIRGVQFLTRKRRIPPLISTSHD